MSEETVIKTKLTKEEIEFLEKEPKCKHCGHSVAFENAHCCIMCLVPGCGCEGEDGTR